MKIKLRDYQKDAISFHLNKRWSYNAYKVGYGKTIMALESARVSQASRICVVAPAYLVEQWVEASKNWDVSCFIFSYDKFQKIDTAESFDFYIFDEAHYLKNWTTKRTKFVYSHLSKNIKAFRLFLSGTPFKNEVSDLYPLLRLTDFDHTFMIKYPTLWMFQTEFANKYSFFIGSREITQFKGLKKDKVSALQTLLRKVMIRNKPEDDLKLPERTRTLLNFKLKERLTSPLSLETLKDIENGTLAHLMAIKCKIALSHVEFTVSRALEVLEEKDKLLIYSDHIDPVLEIYRELKAKGVRCSYIVGSVDTGDRNEVTEDFRNTDLQVVVATIGAYSTGLNLQFCNHTIFNDMPWIPASVEQAEGRTYRSGQDMPTFFDYVVSDSVQGEIFKVVTRKSKQQKEVIDNGLN